MSIQPIYDAVANEVTKHSFNTKEVKHLDIGAGTGGLINFLAKKFSNIKSSGCDYHIERLNCPGIEKKQVDLDKGVLPYDGATFDLVTITEVLEHVENYRSVLREIYRILKPGGMVIVSTPNVLNALSRCKDLLTGFANLFGPLPVKTDSHYSAGQHITPIPYFYMAHALLAADFTKVELSIDKVNKASAFFAVLYSPFIALNSLSFFLKETYKYKTITPENKPHVCKHFSAELLMGRTIIVCASKK